MRGSLAGTLVVYWLAVAGLLTLSLGRTDGHLVYPLDDAYVHMAIAKHASQQGVWGVTAERFASASSSPLWTGLLATAYALTGVRDATPFVLSLLAGTAVVVSLHGMLATTGLGPMGVATLLVGVILAGTLPTLTVLGMEHTLHVLVTLWFVFIGARLVARPDVTLAEAAPLALLAATLTVTRYEGLFAVAVVSATLALTRHWRAALLVGASGAATVLAYGIWSQMQGGFLLPNSVLLKGVAPQTSLVSLAQTALFWRALTGLATYTHLAYLVVAALGLFLMARAEATRDRGAIVLAFVACALLHLQFARVGWLYRYEAYLIVLGALAVGVAVAPVSARLRETLRQSPVHAAAAVALVALLAFPLVWRGVTAIRQTPTAAANIYEQQYQAGLFLGEYYRGARVAVNDVGAVGYLADIAMLDIWGLASVETARLKREGAFSTDTLEALAAREGVEVAVIYPTWLEEYGGVPRTWERVGEWGVTDNVVLGESQAVFYAVAPGARDRLAASLAAFAPRLPAGVIQRGAYLDLR